MTIEPFLPKLQISARYALVLVVLVPVGLVLHPI